MGATHRGTGSQPGTDAAVSAPPVMASATADAGHHPEPSVGSCTGFDGGEEAAAATPDALAAAALSERAVRLLYRYGLPDHKGWALAPADIRYRLHAWHKIDLTMEQVVAGLATVPGRRHPSPPVSTTIRPTGPAVGGPT